MKIFPACLLLLLFFTFGSAQICDETRSVNKRWTLQAREREETRAEREAYYKSLSPEALSQISDFDVYPTYLMTCGMGFSEGLAKVVVDGKAGFINRVGKIVVRPQFNDVGRFSEKLARFEISDGKWGFIDQQGKVVIKPGYDWALDFSEGLAAVQVGEKWGFVNINGQIVVAPQFDQVDSFAEGLAHVQTDRDRLWSGYINKSGKLVIPMNFNGGTSFLKGKAIVGIDKVDQSGRYEDTSCYEIDRTGKKLREVDSCHREEYTGKRRQTLGIQLFFDKFATGYKTASGKVVWKPTK